ncbi:hypothetical protein TKK_0011559 [Trichogramma kaykai]
MIRVACKGEEVRAAVDSGATHNFASPELVPEQERLPTEYTQEFEIEVFITPRNQLVLGIPFVEQEEAILDFRRRVLHVGRDRRTTAALIDRQPDFESYTTLPSHGFPEEYDEEVKKLLTEFRHVLASDGLEEGTNSAQHVIRLSTDKPFRKSSYRYSEETRKEIERQVQEMLASGIIEPRCGWDVPEADVVGSTSGVPEQVLPGLPRQHRGVLEKLGGAHSPPHKICHRNCNATKSAHGGTAIIINSKFQHSVLKGHREENLQATSIRLECQSNSLVVSAIYCPPALKISQVEFENFFSTLGNRFGAGGDWNAKHPWWGSTSQTPNPRGRQLYEAVTHCSCVTVSTGKPTYWPIDPKKLPDLIDFAVAKGVSKNLFFVASILDLTSDHTPVIIHLDMQGKKRENLRKKTNWNSFKKEVTLNLSCAIPLRHPVEIEKSVTQFADVLHEAVAKATTTLKDAGKHRCTTSGILQKINEKRRLRREWQKNRNAVTKARLNKAIKDLKHLLKETKNSHIRNYLQNLTATEASGYSLWKATK